MSLAWRSAVAVDRAAAPTPTPPPSNFEIFDAAATASQKSSACRTPPPLPAICDRRGGAPSFVV